MPTAIACGWTPSSGPLDDVLAAEASHHDTIPHPVSQQRSGQHGGFPRRPDDIAGSGILGFDCSDHCAGDGTGVNRHDPRLGQCAGEFGVAALELAVGIVLAVRMPWRELGFDEPRVTHASGLYQYDAYTELP